MPDDGLTFRPVTAATRADFVALFESPGAPKYCWCMAWRTSREEVRETAGEARRRQMLGRIDAGTPVGLVGYRNGSPVAWVSIAPRETYRELGGPPQRPEEWVWSLVCMYIRREERGQGMAYRLIEAAIEHAREHGATTLEAYPVDPESPSYRFMGFVPAFEKLGFTEWGLAGTRRHVMRLTLRQPGRGKG